MKPKEFRKRFLKTIRKGAPSRLKRFVKFNKIMIESLKLSPEDRAILLKVGLPESAAPFLDFNAYDIDKLNDYSVLVPDPARFYIIGHNGSGDAIAIDKNIGHIVFFNHDMDLEKVFINSSVVKLAKCLCLYAENRKSKNPDELFDKLVSTDSAIEDGKSFWITEIEILRDEIS
jgi:hypothetical protein